MSLSDIKESFYDALEAATIGDTATPDYPVYLPNTTDSRLPEAPESNHLRPFVLPSETRTIGLATLDQEVGTLQVSIFIAKGKNDLAASDIAKKVLALFPRNTVLSLSGSPVARIDETGSIARSFFDEGWQITPVSIPYQNLC